MSMLSVRSIAAPVLLATCFGATAAAEEIDRFLDLRVGVTSSPSPEITEKVKPKSGPSSRYEWKDAKERGYEVDASAAKFRYMSWGGLGGSLHLIGGDYDITPKAVVRSDGAAFTTGGLKLHYRTLGAQLAWGYCYATSHDPEDLAIHLEVLPFFGAGGSQGETSGAGTSGGIVRQSGLGYYFEWGARAGVYLTERNFIVGATSFYANGGGRVVIDLDGGGKSRLYTKRDGFGFGAEAGWRF